MHQTSHHFEQPIVDIAKHVSMRLKIEVCEKDENFGDR
jgi:hypothetical protein